MTGISRPDNVCFEESCHPTRSLSNGPDHPEFGNPTAPVAVGRTPSVRDRGMIVDTMEVTACCRDCWPGLR
jgi:hypothetical protein